MFSETAMIPEGTTMTLSEGNIYNCFRNVLARYNNNTFSVTWVNGTTYSFTIPDGGFLLMIWVHT